MGFLGIESLRGDSAPRRVEDTAETLRREASRGTQESQQNLTNHRQDHRQSLCTRRATQ